MLRLGAGGAGGDEGNCVGAGLTTIVGNGALRYPTLRERCANGNAARTRTHPTPAPTLRSLLLAKRV